MAAIERVPVAPAVLAWARRTAGFDVATAAKRVQVKPERLAAWEDGSISPTITQLRNLSRLYKRPLVVLLLPEPPRDFDALRDFRRIGDAAKTASWSPALHAEFKRALSQREVMLELAELAPSALPEAPEQFSFSRSAGAEQIGEELRALLGMDDWPAGTWSDPHLVLRRTIEATERLSVLVLQTRDVSIAEMRAFSISERPYPVVVLNGADWPRPRLFSLLHELCHLGLNMSSLCDLHEVEHFCNQVAAAALMPRAQLLDDPAVRQRDAAYPWTITELVAAIRRYGVSSEAFLLRLVSLRRATWDTYWLRRPELEREYAEARERQKARQREGDGGPSYYTVKARNLGHGYVHSVIDAFQARAISSLDVADYLDIRFDQLPKLEEAVS
jgi:Zn-dependent peptidase ImmA (M78 family)